MAAKLIYKTPMKTGSREQISMDPVEVYCRIRPISDQEICARALDEQTLQITEPLTSEKPLTASQEETVKGVQAKFTHVFESNIQQKEIFDRVSFDLCEDLILGKNGLLFMYGVSGSGKTYTMTGGPSDVGVLPRCLDVIFNSVTPLLADSYVFVPDKQNGFDVRTKAVAEMDRARLNLCPPSSNGRGLKSRKLADSEWDLNSRVNEQSKIHISKFDEDSAFAVFVSYIQIYNYYIYDLLDTPAPNSKLPPSKILREDTLRNVMYVEGGTEVEIRSTEEAFEVLARGQKMRQKAQTVLNEESSRSHSIFTIRLVKSPLDESGSEVFQDKSKIHVAQLVLVDLAGSERTSRTGNDGKRLAETCSINNSLFTLRQCLEQLRENQKTGKDLMVPYRNSKLTHFFKSYFDGEGKVKMIVCIKPSLNDYKENLQVLKFAELTKDVKVLPGVSAQCQSGDGLTPGRRRAAQIIKEVKDELEQMMQRHRLGSPTAGAAILPQPPQFPLAFEPMPFIDLGNVDEETLKRLRQHFESQLNKRQAIVAEVSAKQSAFEEALKKYIIEMESLKRRHDECGNYIKDLNQDNRRLKEENRRLREQNATYEGRLRKFELDARSHLSREEAMKERERMIVANYRAKDDKLRAVKEIFDRPPTGAPIGGATKRRGPSPPPKMFRLKNKELVSNGPAFNLRPNRRSQSIGDLSVDGQQPSTSRQQTKFVAVTPYCPGRQRKVKYETSSSDSDFAGKRRSDEGNESASAAKRGREN